MAPTGWEPSPRPKKKVCRRDDPLLKTHTQDALPSTVPNQAQGPVFHYVPDRLEMSLEDTLQLRESLFKLDDSPEIYMYVPDLLETMLENTLELRDKIFEVIFPFTFAVAFDPLGIKFFGSIVWDHEEPERIKAPRTPEERGEYILKRRYKAKMARRPVVLPPSTTHLPLPSQSYPPTLLTLHPELRNEIFHLVLAPTETDVIYSDGILAEAKIRLVLFPKSKQGRKVRTNPYGKSYTFRRLPLEPDLALVNHQARNEVLSVFYGQRSIYLEGNIKTDHIKFLWRNIDSLPKHIQQGLLFDQMGNTANMQRWQACASHSKHLRSITMCINADIVISTLHLRFRFQRLSGGRLHIEQIPDPEWDPYCKCMDQEIIDYVLQYFGQDLPVRATEPPPWDDKWIPGDFDLQYEVNLSPFVNHVSLVEIASMFDAIRAIILAPDKIGDDEHNEHMQFGDCSHCGKKYIDYVAAGRRGYESIHNIAPRVSPV